MELFRKELFKPYDNVHISPHRRNPDLSGVILCGVKLIKFNCLYFNLLIGMYESNILLDYGIDIDPDLIKKIKKFMIIRKDPNLVKNSTYFEFKHWANNIHFKELIEHKSKLFNLYGQCVNIIHSKIQEYNGEDSIFILDSDEIYVKDDIDFSFIEDLGIPYSVEYIDALVYKLTSYIKMYDNNVDIKGDLFDYEKNNLIISMKEAIRNNNINNILK